MTLARPRPDLSLETALGLPLVAGVDEVGRGPLAGPVTAAAVILDPARIPPGIDDSKRLSERMRQRLALEIRESALAFAVAHASVEEIDALNILEASHLAMRRALAALTPAAQHALIDGNRLPKGLEIPAQTVVKGDAISLSIAAASILAKVERDAIMRELALANPGYGWEKNMGYPSAQHRVALEQQGVTPHHRRSFGPVRKMLC
ncbi:ribonuclease HII [Pararhodobacter aggregans]|uniref:Ribonuclease HII n=1 Tax=Pararhodobacter aggregans TaxID=404875 RepID=A0A2T7UTL0_9RHOB|nr:ribonuclease HII [Pararhodobacter aggregans]PTX02892.1 RNase HII [Pararhodobacter aggregans]PVE48110.1 ribonuclease HII [Pararhodobacter aggregans]